MISALALLLAVASAEIPAILCGSDGQMRLMAGVALPPRTTGTKVIVGVIDTGILTSHPQIEGLIIAEKDFTGEGPSDRVGHGTVAALQALRWAALGASELKIATPAVFLINAKVASKTYAPTQETLRAAIEWSVAQGAEVINISVGVKGEEDEFTDLCQTIASSQALFFAAAGDPNDPTPVYPAACDAPNLESVADVEPPETEGVFHDRSLAGWVHDRWFFYAEEGRRAAAAGDFTQAKKLLGQSLTLEETPYALFHLSTILHAEGDVETSMKLLRRCLELNAKDVQCNVQLGSLLLMTRRQPAAAIPHLRIALDVGGDEPAFLPYRINLAIALVQAGRLQEGRAELQRVLAIDAKNASARELLDDLERMINEPR